MLLTANSSDAWEESVPKFRVVVESVNILGSPGDGQAFGVNEVLYLELFNISNYPT